LVDGYMLLYLPTHKFGEVAQLVRASDS